MIISLFYIDAYLSRSQWLINYDFNQIINVTIKYNFEFNTSVTVEDYDTKSLLVLSKTAAYKTGADAIMPLSINGADQMCYVKLITNKGTVTKKILASKL